jgi:hypothetical protein
MKKIVVTVPVKDADMIRQAIGEAGGGKLGKYAFCSFSSRGIGRFKPLEGANPSIGEVGILEEVEEERIEISCPTDYLLAVIATINRVHPYETPVIDVYNVEN